MKILIVDDFISQITILKSILEEYDVFEANCGLSAIELANSILPDIIIMDTTMPGVNGYAALKILKSTEATKNIPVIMTSETTTDFDRLKVSFLGASKLLAKPFTKESVLDVLKLVPQAYLKHCLEKELDSSNRKKSNFVKV
jgi:twitching motility two-component system response regulator PilH